MQNALQCGLVRQSRPKAQLTIVRSYLCILAGRLAGSAILKHSSSIVEPAEDIVVETHLLYMQAYIARFGSF